MAERTAPDEAPTGAAGAVGGDRRAPLPPLPPLPGLGEWDGPIHGQLGVLATDEDRVVCHICGRVFRALANHVRQAHGLPPQEYRAIFGLRASTSLDAPSLRDVKRRNAAPHLARYRAVTRRVVEAMTTEERRALALGRRLRLEARLDPKNQAIWRTFQEQGRARPGRSGRTRCAGRSGRDGCRPRGAGASPSPAPCAGSPWS